MSRKNRRRRQAAGQPQLLRKKVSGTTYQVANWGGRQRSYGPWGDPDGIDDFRADLSAWLETGAPLPDEPEAPAGSTAGLTVAELSERYKVSVRAEHAPDWFTRNESRIRYACDVLVELYGTEVAAEFGPKKLKLVQVHLCRLKRADNQTPRLTVKTINERVRTIVGMFAWAVSDELIPPAVLEGLRAVLSVRQGKPGTRASRKVAPVSDADYEAVLPYLNKPVRALVKLLWLTGARPGELFGLRPSDIDRSATPWTARLEDHKTAWKGKGRVLHFGAEARRVLEPFLLRAAKRPLFSPSEGSADTRRARREARATPLWRSHEKRYELEKADRPRQTFSTTYDAPSLRKAVLRAIDRCNRDRKAATLDPIASWFPYQLRHSAATRIRKEHGIEASRVLLGHTSAGMTEIYAEADLTRAAAIAERAS